MKNYGKGSIFIISMLLILFLSIAMVSASDDIGVEDSYISDDSLDTGDSSIKDNDFMESTYCSVVLNENESEGSADSFSVSDLGSSDSFSVSDFRSDLGSSDSFSVSDLGSSDSLSSSDKILKGSKSGNNSFLYGFEEKDNFKLENENDADVIFKSDNKKDSRIDVSGDLETSWNGCYLYVSLLSDSELISSSIDVYINGEFSTTVKTSDEENIEVCLKGFKKGSNNVTFNFNGTDAFDPSSITVEILYLEDTNIDLFEYNSPIGSNLTVLAGLYDGMSDVINKEFTVYLNEYFYDEDLGDYATRIVERRTVVGEETLVFDSSYFNYTFDSNSHYDGEQYFYLEAEFGGGDNYRSSDCISYFAILPKDTHILVEGPSQMDVGRARLTAYLYPEGYDDYYELYGYLLDVYINDEFYKTAKTYNGYANIDLRGLNIGSNKVDIKFNGSNGFLPSNYTLNVIIYEEISRITVDSPVVVKGND